MAKRSNGPGERISEAEHAIMEVLWDRNPISAAEVCDAVCAERDWSQGELATRLGISRQSVNAIETGRYDPSLPLAFRIADIFELAIEEIFLREE